MSLMRLFADDTADARRLGTLIDHLTDDGPSGGWPVNGQRSSAAAAAIVANPQLTDGQFLTLLDAGLLGNDLATLVRVARLRPDALDSRLSTVLHDQVVAAPDGLSDDEAVALINAISLRRDATTHPWRSWLPRQAAWLDDGRYRQVNSGLAFLGLAGDADRFRQALADPAAGDGTHAAVDLLLSLCDVTTTSPRPHDLPGWAQARLDAAMTRLLPATTTAHQVASLTPLVSAATLSCWLEAARPRRFGSQPDHLHDRLDALAGRLLTADGTLAATSDDLACIARFNDTAVAAALATAIIQRDLLGDRPPLEISEETRRRLWSAITDDHDIGRLLTTPAAPVVLRLAGTDQLPSCLDPDHLHLADHIAIDRLVDVTADPPHPLLMAALTYLKQPTSAGWVRPLVDLAHQHGRAADLISTAVDGVNVDDILAPPRLPTLHTGPVADVADRQGDGSPVVVVVHPDRVWQRLQAAIIARAAGGDPAGRFTAAITALLEATDDPRVPLLLRNLWSPAVADNVLSCLGRMSDVDAHIGRFTPQTSMAPLARRLKLGEHPDPARAARLISRITDDGHRQTLYTMLCSGRPDSDVAAIIATGDVDAAAAMRLATGRNDPAIDQALVGLDLPGLPDGAGWPIDAAQLADLDDPFQLEAAKTLGADRLADDPTLPTMLSRHRQIHPWTTAWMCGEKELRDAIVAAGHLAVGQAAATRGQVTGQLLHPIVTLTPNTITLIDPNNDWGITGYTRRLLSTVDEPTAVRMLELADTDPAMTVADLLTTATATAPPVAHPAPVAVG